MRRKLIIDLQIFQSPAWDRGMGKFTLELISAILQDLQGSEWSEVQGIVSSLMGSPDNMENIVEKRLKGLKIIKLNLLPDEIGNDKVLQNNRTVINEYLNSQLRLEKGTKIDYFLPSPLQGYICAPLPFDSQSIQKVVLAHDLIPLTFHGLYLESPITRQEYLSRMHDFLRADVYVTNSKTTANDIVTYLDVDKSRVCSIDGGPVNHSEIPKDLKIKKPFILMPTGNDLRKNNERAANAFNQFNKLHDNKYTLVITSYFEEFQKERLNKLCDNIFFTGNVEGSEMKYLYQNADAMLFPSEYEGLGLPLLEAVQYGKKIACSNIPVFLEISQNAFIFFDPYSIPDIIMALEKVTDKYAIDKREYTAIIDYYSWQSVAQKFKEAVLRDRERTLTSNLPQLSILAPNPSDESIAGNFAQKCFAEMSRVFGCSYFLSPKRNSETRINFLPYITSCKTIEPAMNYEVDSYSESLLLLDSTEGSADVLFSALACNGFIALLNMNLSKPWKAMVSKGLINESRLKLEKELADRFDISQHWYLTSLLIRRQTFIVFDKKTESDIKQLVKKLNLETKIFYVQNPASSLAYDDAKPQKTQSYIYLSRLLNTSNTDFERNLELSKTKFLIVDCANREDILLDALRLQAIPVMTSMAAAQIDLDKNCYISIGKSSFIEELINEIIEISEDKYLKLQYSAKSFIRGHYNYKDFAAKILNLSESNRNR